MTPIAWRPKKFESDSEQIYRSDFRLESAQKELFPENPRRTYFNNYFTLLQGRYFR